MIPADSPSIQDEYKVLLNELSMFNPELLEQFFMQTVPPITQGEIDFYE
jgi:hypothetical protein